MSLATRCTACGTIFRVVQDQLRVSEGWVRCGRCAEVFDAREQLFDIDREAPPPWPAVPGHADAEPLVEAPPPPAPPTPSPVWTSAPTPVSPPLTPPPPARPEPPPAPAPPAIVFAREPEPAPAALAEEAFTAARDESAVDSSQLHSRQEPQWVDEDPAQPPAGVAMAPAPMHAEPAAAIEPAMQDFGTDTVLAPGLAEAAIQALADKPGKSGKPGKAPKAKKAGKQAVHASADAQPIPEFMRRAQQSERWRQPRVRAALGVCAGLLIVLFAYQFVRQFHNAVAAVYPPALPTMQAFCELSGCELQPWRRIDVIGVDASALNQAGPNNQYQLTVNLRNKSGLDVATPWVELSLTDAAGSVIARRMLAPTEFKGGKAAMPPGAELPLQLLLSTGDQRVSGYSVEIFHP